jgi:hypothetical protein
LTLIVCLVMWPFVATEPPCRRAPPPCRSGLPADIAGTAIWLASPASGYVTRAAVPVDGGFSSSFFLNAVSPAGLGATQEEPKTLRGLLWRVHHTDHSVPLGDELPQLVAGNRKP